MSIGLIFIVVLAFTLIGSIFRKDNYGKHSGRDRTGGSEASLLAVSSPDLLDDVQNESRSPRNDPHGQRHHGGADYGDGGHRHGNPHHGHGGEWYNSGGFDGHSHGGHSSGGFDSGHGSGGDMGGGGDCGGGGGD